MQGWVSVTPQMGLSYPGSVDTTQLTPVGTIARFRSNTLGEGEFIYLAGGTSILAGSVCSYEIVYDSSVATSTVALWAGTANAPVSLGVATAATVDGTWGWYQIGGSAITNSNGTVAAADNLYWQAAGVVSHTAVAGKQMMNAVAASANDVPDTDQVIVTLDRPLAQGADDASSQAITVGVTAITSGTTNRTLYDNAGILGELTVTGTGTVDVRQTSATLITPILGVATGTSLALGGFISQTSGATFFLGTTASADTMTVDASPALTAYTTGAMYTFICGAANTGASTLNVNSLGAKSIVKRASTATAANDMLTNGMYMVLYDGTSLHLLNPAVP